MSIFLVSLTDRSVYLILAKEMWPEREKLCGDKPAASVVPPSSGTRHHNWRAATILKPQGQKPKATKRQNPYLR
ncbi:hypothetical protein P7K49_012075 [Saguinus oedipus]|uniref:Uncharacterized protein n=1 Tax=Saguinus oedipus TaxID=9490 RepID=A0ABQ9VUV2_SAGOE|nr:hypothetical protein P7K49_012075 [Saguinus oedipus]